MSDVKKFYVTVYEVVYQSSSFEVHATDYDAAKELADEINLHANLDFDAYDSEYVDTEYEESSVAVSEKESELFKSACVDKNGWPVEIGDKIKFQQFKYYDENQKLLREPKEIDIVDEVCNIAYDPGDGSAAFLVKHGHLICGVEAELVNISAEDVRLSERDYWMKHGNCPVCRVDGTIETSAGQFVCNKCNWKK